MLLRSSSTPVLNSWISQSKETSSPEPETVHRNQKPRSISLTLPPISSLSNDLSIKKMTRVVSETNLSVPKKNLYVNALASAISVEKVSERSEMLDKLFSSSGLLEEGCAVWSEEIAQTGGGYGGSGRGGGCGGSDGSSSNWDSNYGSDNSTDVYYQNMIESNPGNALILANYAKFLKEVKSDYAKAEEYCARAILANPNDGDVLSLYADLIWRSHKDASRAETYFDQAVQAAPDDCYVLASYAKFLWDAEEDEEEKTLTSTSESSLLQGFGHSILPSQIAAAS